MANQFIFGSCTCGNCSCINFEGFDGIGNTSQCLCGHFKNYHVKYVLSNGMLIQIPTARQGGTPETQDSSLVSPFSQNGQTHSQYLGSLRAPAAMDSKEDGSAAFSPDDSFSPSAAAASFRPPGFRFHEGKNNNNSTVVEMNQGIYPGTAKIPSPPPLFSVGASGAFGGFDSSAKAVTVSSWTNPFTSSDNDFTSSLHSCLAASTKEDASTAVVGGPSTNNNASDEFKWESFVACSSYYDSEHQHQQVDASHDHKAIVDDGTILEETKGWKSAEQQPQQSQQQPDTGVEQPTMDDNTEMTNAERLDYLNNTALMLYTFVHQVFATTSRYFRFDRDMKKFYSEFPDSKKMVAYCGGIYVILATFPFCFQRIEDRSHHSVIIMLRTVGDSFKGIGGSNRHISGFIGCLSISKSDVGQFTDAQLARSRMLLEDLDARNMQQQQHQQQHGNKGLPSPSAIAAASASASSAIQELSFADVVVAARELKAYITTAYVAQMYIMPLGKDSMSFYNAHPQCVNLVKAVGGISKLCALFPSVFSVFQCLHTKAMFTRLIQSPATGLKAGGMGLGSQIRSFAGDCHATSDGSVSSATTTATVTVVDIQQEIRALTQHNFSAEQLTDILSEFPLIQQIPDAELASTLACLVHFMISNAVDMTRPFIRLDKQVAEFYNFYPKCKMVLKMVGGLLGICDKYPTMFCLEEIMGGVKGLRLLRSTTRDLRNHHHDSRSAMTASVGSGAGVAINSNFVNRFLPQQKPQASPSSYASSSPRNFSTGGGNNHFNHHSHSHHSQHSQHAHNNGNNHNNNNNRMASSNAKPIRDVAVALHSYIRMHGLDGGRKMKERDLFVFYSTQLSMSLNSKHVIDVICGGILGFCERAPDLFRRPIDLGGGKGLLILARTTPPSTPSSQVASQQSQHYQYHHQQHQQQQQQYVGGMGSNGSGSNYHRSPSGSPPLPPGPPPPSASSSHMSQVSHHNTNNSNNWGVSSSSTSPSTSLSSTSSWMSSSPTSSLSSSYSSQPSYMNNPSNINTNMGMANNMNMGMGMNMGMQGVGGMGLGLGVGAMGMGMGRSFRDNV